MPAARHFFLLGAAKAGSTSLHTWLDQHPALQMSDPKEPFFFEAEYDKGLDYYHRTYFAGWDGQRLLGDARHRNLYFSYIPERIHSLCPDARLIVVLRNPVDRAYAHWWHWYRLGREDLPFCEALAVDEARIRAGISVSTPQEITEYARTLDADGMGPYRTYLDSGYYAEQLERYFALFARDRLKVILLEDMISNPRQIFNDTCKFLGIDTMPATSVDLAARNTSGRLRWRHSRDKILARLSSALRNEPFSLLTSSGRKRLLARPSLEPGLRKWLCQHYEPHNLRLGGLLGIDLSSWK